MIIEVDNRYSAAFSSIVTLFRCGCDLSKIIEGVTDNEIYERNTKKIYRLVDTDFVEDEQEFVLEEKGASWFRGVRGEEMNVRMASWLTLIENVAEAYHNQCSFIEYDSNNISKEETKKIVEVQKNDVRALIETFFPELQFTINDLPAGSDYDDIYGVILKLSVSSGGTGESKPVIGKLYFQKGSFGTSVKLKPLSFDGAYDIDRFFDQNIGLKSEQEIESLGEVETAIINNVGSAVEEMVNKNISEILLNEAIIFDENDKKLIDNMHEKNPFIGITVSDIKILSITHVTWNNYAYDIIYNGDAILRVKFGINNNISITCLRCSEDVFVGGKITYSIGEKLYTDFISVENGVVNLPAEKIKNILRYSAISEHIYFNRCQVATRNLICQNPCCKKMAIDFAKGNKYCANCPYPEVVFETSDQQLVLMKDMQYAYAYGRPTLVDNSASVERCNFCGRYFVNGEEYCELCSHICVQTEGVDLEEASQLYKKYRSMLPLGVRLFNLFKKKYCFEDAELIIFKIGKHGYYFEKINLYTDKGCRVVKADWRDING